MNKATVDVIAIDGPAGSGKSTTAMLVARKLGFLYLDTGAMYRAITLKALQNGIDLNNEKDILQIKDDTRLELTNTRGRFRIFLDGKNVTRAIRKPEISQNVAVVAAHPGVRRWMVELQRKLGEAGKIIAEGRDIGTAVFPDARLKIFLIASLEERARRRKRDFSQDGESLALHQISAELKKRDEIDSSRAVGPLKKADDAIELDTTNMTIEQQVDFIVEQWKNKITQ